MLQTDTSDSWGSPLSEMRMFDYKGELINRSIREDKKAVRTPRTPPCTTGGVRLCIKVRASATQQSFICYVRATSRKEE